MVYGINPKEQCLCHTEQQNDFSMKREIKWGKRYFCSMNWVYDELFMNKEIIPLMEESGLKGFHFRSVNVKNKKSETTVQLIVEKN